MRDHTGFLIRNPGVSRLEAFSDAVFAFALALLVISTEVPGSVAELLARLRNLPAFGLSFTILIYLWYNHNVFFRRYALETPGVVAINGILLFVVLIYTYPLKVLPGFVIAAVTGVVGTDLVTIQTMGEAKALMAIYSAGFGAVFLCLSWLTLIALRRRDELGLEPREVLATRASLGAHLWQVGIALVSLFLLLVTPGIAAAGWVFATMGPILFFHFRFWARRAARLASVSGTAS